MPEPWITTNETARTLQNFRDFDMDFIAHPVTGDLVIKKGANAVSQALKNLVLLHSGELGFNPEKGSGVHYLLFENFTPANINMLQKKITEVILFYEPRAELVQLIVSDEADDNHLKVDVVYRIQNSEQPITVTLFLERVR